MASMKDESPHAPGRVVIHVAGAFAGCALVVPREPSLMWSETELARAIVNEYDAVILQAWYTSLAEMQRRARDEP